MKAMVFAAGRGTRLGALTEKRPKALVEVGGAPLLEHVLRRLRAAGVREVMINTHHFAAQIEAFVAAHDGFGLKVFFSHEPELLDTGGGLKKVASFFAGNAPFLLHNVDVLSTIDLAALVADHRASAAWATLAVKARPTARPLIFDDRLRLCGRRVPAGPMLVRPIDGPAQELGFCGIHVVSPVLLQHLTETGAFSIIDGYLRLAREGHPILGARVDACSWRDCGRPEDLRPLET